MTARARAAQAWGTASLAALLAWVPAVPGAAVSASDGFDTVVIDAGHGGEDFGAIGSAGSREKDVVLGVARELAKRLRGRGLQVVMTRDQDLFVSLEQRTAIANDARGDMFLSIHANADSDPASHGTETYFLALEASDTTAARVASRENRSFNPDGEPEIEALRDPFIALLGDLITTEHHEESSELARDVQKSLATTALRTRGVKQALFVVLTGVQMPASLVEIGFVTNPEDEGLLAKRSGRDAIVDALEQAVLEFGRRYDARRGVGAAATTEP